MERQGNRQMTTEFFITLLSDFLNKRETKQPEDIDWAELMRVAKLHEMAGIVYYQCKNFIPVEYQEQLNEFNASTLFYYANRVKEEKTVLQKLRDAGVRCFIIKGSAVAAYYPAPALRTMGDTDIVVDDAEKAHEVLMASGYTCKTKCAAYYKNDLLFEIHDHLTYVNGINSPDLVDFFNGYWDYVKDGELDWSFHLLFIILHLRGHFYGSGVGVRQFMDIAALTKYNEALDWPWIEQKLKELDLWAFSEKVFDLNRRWFGISAPMTVEPVEDAFYKEATNELCSGGAFGTKSNNGRRIAAHGYKHPVLSMLKRAWGMVFVPYKNMIRMPQYSFLVGRPYLLPVAWIYRGWLTIKKKGMKSTTKSLQDSFVSKEAVEKQKTYIEKWNQ